MLGTNHTTAAISASILLLLRARAFTHSGPRLTQRHSHIAQGAFVIIGTLVNRLLHPVSQKISNHWLRLVNKRCLLTGN